MAQQSITLQTSDADIVSGDVLGRVNFAASNESSGSEAKWIGASVFAEASGEFTATVNPTNLVFATSDADGIVARHRVTNVGHFVPLLNTTYNLGSASFKYNNIFSATGTLDRIVTTGIQLTGSVSRSGLLFVNNSDLVAASPNVLFSDADLASPKLIFKASGSLTPDISLNMLTTATNVASGVQTLSVQGSAGELFSITDVLDSGTIFSVNDISGLGLIEADADGTVTLARYGSNVAVGNVVPTQKLHVAGNLRVSGAFFDSLNSPGTSGQVLVSTSGGTDWRSLGEITGVDGVGTSGYVARWTDGDTIGTGIIYDNGTNVGIGTTSPGNTLTVNGNLRLVTPTLNGLFAYDAANGGAFIWSLTRYTLTDPNDLNINTRNGFGIRTNVTSLTNSDHQFYITNLGNVGIGTTSPSAKLDVRGTGYFSESIRTSGTVVFASGNTAPVGVMQWDDGEGTVRLGLKGGNVTASLAQDNVILCYNGTGSSLAKGQVVYVSGAQGQRPSVNLALATSDLTSARTIGLVDESIGIGAEGFVATFGVVTNLNTAAFTTGSGLWLSSTTPGAITMTRPVAPNHGVFLGWCLNSHASAGRIFVEVQNGVELEEIHDVLIQSVASGDLLQYDSSNSTWRNRTAQQAGLIDGKGSQYYVPVFSDSNTLGESQIYDNGTNIGVGTTSPSQKLDVRGNTYISGVLTVSSGDFGESIVFHNGYKIRTFGGGGLEILSNPYTRIGNTGGTYVAGFTAGSNAGPGLSIGPIASQTGLIITGAAAQSADLQQWQNSAGTALVRVDSAGSISGVASGIFMTSLKVGSVAGDNITRAYIEENFASQQANGLRVRGIGSSTSIWKGRIVAGGDNVAFLMGEYNSQAWLGGHNAALNTWSPLRINPDGTTDLYLGNTGAAGANPIVTIKNSDGNVGIGTTFPSQKLSVSGNALIGTEGSTRVLVKGGGGSDTIAEYLSLEVNPRWSIGRDLIGGGSAGIGFSDTTNTIATGGSAVGIPYPTPRALAFYTSNATSLIERMRIDGNGNVGIGSNSPSYKLDINGSQRSYEGGSYEVVKHGSFNLNDGTVGNFNYFFGVGTTTVRATAIDLTLVETNIGHNVLKYTIITNYDDLVELQSTKKIVLPLYSNNPRYENLSGQYGGAAHELQIWSSTAGQLDVRFVVKGSGNGSNPAWHWTAKLKNCDITTTPNTSGIDTTSYQIYRHSQITHRNSNVGIGTDSPSQKLHVNGNIRVSGAYYDSLNSPGTNGQVLTSTATGTDWKSLSEITGVDGVGTSGYVARWLDADTVGTGVIYDNGTNVGIGTASPSSRFTIASGDLEFTVNGQYGIRWPAGSRLYEQTGTTGGVERMLYQPNGDRFEVLTENGAAFIAGFHGVNSALTGIRLYSGTIIGNTFSSNNSLAPPGNGLLVEGNVGIFNTSPQNLLTIGSGIGTGANVNSTAGYGLGIHHSGIIVISPETAADNAIHNLINLTVSKPAAYWGGQATIDFNVRDRGNNYPTRTAARITGGDENTGAGYNGILSFATALNSGTAPATAMTIINNGNVGIGTTSPTAKLHIETGAATTTGVIVRGAASQTADLQQWQNSAGVDAASVTSAGSFFTRAATAVQISNGRLWQLTADSTTLNVRDGTASLTRVTFDNNGNVGIGTTNPQYLLDVSGTIRANHITAITKSFLIDHPTKPGKSLRYASLEGPENGIYLRGSNSGNYIILPDYWCELVNSESITVNLTPVGTYQQLWVKSKNVHYIEVGGADGAYDYAVWAERKDVPKLEVEC